MNLNDYCIVRLTEYGEEQWSDWWDFVQDSAIPVDIRKSATLPDGRVKFQIWEAMNIFGPVLWHGNPLMVFVDNEIEFRSAF